MLDTDQEDVAKALNSVTDEDLILALKQFLGANLKKIDDDIEPTLVSQPLLNPESYKLHG